MAAVKIAEFFSFLAFMFTSNIDWNFSDEVSAGLTAVNGESAPSLNLFLYYYFASLALACLYTIFIRPAATKARDGTLGMDKDGKTAKLCTR